MVAVKYNEDEYFGNDFYAKVGGVTKNEIKFLEKYRIKNTLSKSKTYPDFKINLNVPTAST